MRISDKNKPKNRIGGGTPHNGEKRGKRKFAIAGILAALAVVICAGVAVITPAVAASTTNTGGFSMANVISSVKMFYAAGEIEGQNGTTYNGNIIDVEYANIDTDDNPGYLSTADVCAFAVYSEDDNSLTFYNQNIGMAVEGENFRGKTVTALYTGFDTETYTSTTVAPWSSVAENIISVTFADEISPANTSYWFYGFTNCTSIDLDNLDTSNVTTMQCMFSQCESLTSLDVTKLDTSAVTNMQAMFSGCKSLTSLDTSGFTAKLDNILGMFSECRVLTSTLDLSGLDVSKCTNFSGVFSNCRKLESVDVSTWDVTSASGNQPMSAMFARCECLTTLDLSSWDTSNVIGTAYMFYYCSSLTTIYVSSKWSNASIESGSDMFIGCDVLVGGSGTAYATANVSDYTYARIDRPNFGQPGYLTSK